MRSETNPEYPITATMERWRCCRPRQVRNAIHEAGHAVAARLFGCDVRQASITHGDQPEACGSVWTTPEGEGLDAQRGRLIFLAAGGAAVRLALPLEDPGDRTDKLMALETARRIWGMFVDKEIIDRELVQADQRAMALVSRHWPEILDVSEALLFFDDALQRIGSIQRPQIESFDFEYMKGKQLS